MHDSLPDISALHDLTGRYFVTPVSPRNIPTPVVVYSTNTHIMSKENHSQLSTFNLQFDRWYALRVTYSRELVLKEYLDGEGIENFIPMRYEYLMKNGRRVRKLVPAIHNLVFVRSSRRRIDGIRQVQNRTVPPIRYIMDREHHRPVVIPDSQMHSFIAVSGNHDQAVLYLEPSELHLPKGARVRITGGIFEGVEGELIRIRHDRRVVFNIEGVMAVATTYIHQSLIEPVI